MPDSGHKRKRGGHGSSSEDSEAAEERAEHHYMLRLGDEFEKGRYIVLQQLGKGTFGRVVEMRDTEQDISVAVKVVRAVEKYAREAEIESEIIRALQRTLPAEGIFPIVRLHRTFESRGHYCIVFDKMGPSLYNALKAARNNPRSHPRTVAAAMAAAGDAVAAEPPSLEGTSRSARLGTSLRTASARLLTCTGSSSRTPTSSLRIFYLCSPCQRVEGLRRALVSL